MKNIPRYMLFCYWEWLLAFLYMLGVYPYPHLIPLMLSLIYTSMTVIMFSRRLDVIISIIAWELMMVLFVYQKWHRNNSWKDYRLLPDVLLFGLYLVFLYSIGETFYTIYITKVPKFHTKFNDNVVSYIFR